MKRKKNKRSLSVKPAMAGEQTLTSLKTAEQKQPMEVRSNASGTEIKTTAKAEPEYLAEMLGITKIFGTNKVLENITLQLKKGEILALLGENGAGKTTLMRVLFGMYQPDEGELRVRGQKVVLKDPNDATALHIGMVHQHFELVEVFTVLENIVLGAETVEHGFLAMDTARKKLEGLMDRYGLKVDLDAKVENISVGMQQRVEILKMLYRDNEVLIFDEPTAALTPQETEELLEIMRGLAREGKALLFITHKLPEILAVSDRVTVIRKGRYVATVKTSETTEEELSRLMVGRPVRLVVQKEKAVPGDVVLTVKHLTVAGSTPEKDAVRDVSFTVRKGEIVCIAGISGNGQTELVYSLTGLKPVKNGTIIVEGKDLTALPVGKKNEVLSCIPEDRHRHGLVLDFPLTDNLILKKYRETEYQTMGFVQEEKVRDYAGRLIADNDVRCGRGPDTKAGNMSGGNQQKAIIGRELDLDRPLVIAVQPTRGVDVGAIEYIHKRLVAERDRGKAVLLVSLELNEVMHLSDRILVMYEGEITGELDPEKAGYEEIGLYMSGAKRQTRTDPPKEQEKEKTLPDTAGETDHGTVGETGSCGRTKEEEG